ncbi:alpha/beta fold hydrolase, partial [Glycomyces tenuis]|uniref:alpha/beta fold hydrolase n=1 Tax=Glycomyces tenuis TaxID=58116 RepID=UPI00068C1092
EMCIRDSADTARGIDWQPCPDRPDIDCATIEVPLDYDHPHRGTIEIGLARAEAAGPGERIGSLLVNPGGPGGSGVDTVKDGFTHPAFDVIGFDPRGVNTSTPVQCDPALVQAANAIAHPANEAEFEARLAANAALTADCRERTGPLFDHMDTRTTVEDMERIRRAIGEGDLNYLGYSYGTLMGQQYAEEYPHRIRAMVLDGNLDHGIDTAWEFASAETAAFEDNFTAFTAWCDTTPGCALGGGAAAAYEDLKTAARTGTLTDPATGEPVDFHALTATAFAANFPQRWPDLAAALAALRDGVPHEAALAAPESEPVNYAALPIYCQDWSYPVPDFAAWQDLADRAATAFPTVEWSPYNDNLLGCLGTGIEQTNPQGPLDIDNAPPLLIIGTLHDYASVHPWSRTVADQADQHLLTYEGYGHTIYGKASDCIDTVVDAYLIDLDHPRRDQSCPGLDHPPAPAGGTS